MADNPLKVNIAGVDFKNPIIAASGAFGFGREYNRLFPVELLGGISCKGTTLRPRAGNPPPRVAETPSGMLNSVGLQNPGVAHFLAEDLPWLAQKDITIIANIAGHSLPDYCGAALRLEGSAVHMIELNISCPNVKEGGLTFGATCESAARTVREVRRHTTKPLCVKLSPNVTSIADIAAAVEAEGADAVSLINTLTGMKIDIKTRRPILRNNVGGLSGPAVFPVAVRMVREVYKRVKIPVIGMGGVASWQNAVEIMLAGASAVMVGTALFQNPFAALEIIDGLNGYCKANELYCISEITGSVEEWPS
ncbi:MAG: dihydroorotate dehydrogenase [Oscillospiraceae bacterium]|jgi:dihydroorotate dehydrogenase (NAD+) catalytic subunit|nr:dihydroorotate dehydrogenase [Oscillospiraceae bacterium]